MIKNRWHIGLSLLSHSPFSAHIAQRSRCFYNRHPNWFAASITRTADRFLSFGGEDCQEESSVQTLFVIIHCPFACDCFGRPPLSRSALFIVATSSNPITNRILTQTRSAFNLREVMDEGKKILLVNLAKGKIGEDAASLLGALLVTKIGLAGLSRLPSPTASRLGEGSFNNRKIDQLFVCRLLIGLDRADLYLMVDGPLDHALG